tara:strand:+ start:645 stop:1028 length:384 start_codon:yes stop_codon:yes gene_type:complete
MTYVFGEKKYSLFLITVVISAGFLSVPLISSHIFHMDHLFHTIVHQAGFVLATFLTVMALISYLKSKIRRMLFSSFAFGVLAFGQAAYMYSMIEMHQPENMYSGSEILDMSILVMTVLFAIGVFYKK